MFIPACVAAKGLHWEHLLRRPGTLLKSRSNSLWLRVIFMALAIGSPGPLAHAGTKSWSGSGANTSWTTGTNWTGNTAPANDLVTDIAVFDLTVYPRQPTANSVSINGIQIGDGTTATATLAISGSGAGLGIGSSGITIFANAGAATLSALTAIGAAQSWSNGSSNVFTIATGGLTYSNLLTLNGGQFAFNAAGTGTGGVKITAGSTVTNGSTGAIFGTGTLELNSGTYKSSASTTRSLANPVSITGDFTFDAVSTGINEFTGGASTTGNRTLTVNTVTTRFVTSPVTLGGNLTTAGTGRLNITGGLNLGGADRTLTAGATGANGNLLTGPVDSSSSGNKLVLAGNNFSVSGVTPGATNVVNFDVNATGTIVFNGTNTFQGSVTVDAGTLNATTDSALGSSTAATAGLAMVPSSGTATVNFTSSTPAIASLASSGAGTSNVVLGNAATPAATTLTIGGNNASTSFAGAISDNSALAGAAVGNIVKTGTGTLTLTGNNTFTGVTTISGGTLSAAGTGSSKALATTTSVSINSGGTLLMGANNQFSAAAPAPMTLTGSTGVGAATLNVGGFNQGSVTAVGVGALTLTLNSVNNIIDFGSKAGVISFASLAANAATLTINNYVNNNGAAGGADQLIFNQDQSGNLGNIVFTGYGTAAQQLVSGTAGTGSAFYEVFPTIAAVPEPSTVLGGLLMLGALGWSQRRRFR